MASFQADHNVRLGLIEELRRRGHAVGRPGDPDGPGPEASDAELLRWTVAHERTVLTYNRRHFIRLHRRTRSHAGIVVASFDMDDFGLARRIDAAVAAHAPLDGKLVRVPKPPAKPTVEP